jgi:hypothetical protein
MMEWGPGKTPLEQLNLILSQPVSPSALVALYPNAPALQDNRPVNEYNQLRTYFPSKGELGR